MEPHPLNPLLVVLPWSTQLAPVLMGTAELGWAGRYEARVEL